MDALKILIYEIFLETLYGKRKKVINFFDDFLYFP